MRRSQKGISKLNHTLGEYWTVRAGMRAADGLTSVIECRSRLPEKARKIADFVAYPFEFMHEIYPRRAGWFVLHAVLQRKRAGCLSTVPFKRANPDERVILF